MILEPTDKEVGRVGVLGSGRTRPNKTGLKHPGPNKDKHSPSVFVVLDLDPSE